MSGRTASGGFIVAGTGSGCGKTTITLAIMAALRERGVDVRPFKCGPDFIDPSLHRAVCRRPSRNLDARMCGTEFTRRTFHRHRAGGLAVVEGVMGLFDGGGGSAASLARLLGLPVVLVVDARAMAESVAAVVHGFTTLDPDLDLAGVVCNQVGSPRHAQLLSRALEGRCRLLGCVPREEGASVPSRHLGLHMGDEALDGKRIAALARLAARHLDLEALLDLARALPPAPTPPEEEPSPARARIGLARDAAFCFYYQDNLDLLEAAGARLVEFSPLEDAAPPPGLDGIYLGGGYPELHARALAENLPMRQAISRWAAAGRPLYAECGGFMYLCASLRTVGGEDYPMCGVFPGRVRMQPRLAALGYRQVRLARPCLLGPAGTEVRGHEFHYSRCQGMDQVPSLYALDGRPDGFARHRVLAGYLHAHFGAAPGMAGHFARYCLRGAARAKEETGNKRQGPGV